MILNEISFESESFMHNNCLKIHICSSVHFCTLFCCSVREQILNLLRFCLAVTGIRS